MSDPRPEARSPGADPRMVAAVDLGSNSFHMVLARTTEHDLHLLDRLKEPVRLAGGLDAKNRLSDEAMERSLACLERFGQRLRAVPPDNVRALGTNTLRKARNAAQFLTRAEEALGIPIEVISGLEEARLIYLGVAHSHAYQEANRLVVDIGGGSTEIILGEGFEILRSHSLFMGCVNHSLKFFPDGVITREAFRRAETAAGLELTAIEGPLRDMGWESAVGASGTINAVADLMPAVEGSADAIITLPRLKKLRRALVNAGSVQKLSLPGLKPDRGPVLPGGLSVLIAVFKTLGVVSMTASTGALREGILYDLVGRLRHEDVRDRTVRRLVDQYHIDVAQSSRVERTAMRLYRSVEAAWGFEDEMAGRLLGWAASLHECGLAVSYTGYHKHGGYLVTYADMPGFSNDEKRLLAALIRGHRRKLPRTIFADLPNAWRETALRLCLLLRLAVLLNRSRSPGSAAGVSLIGQWPQPTLITRIGWPREHPLTFADLERETEVLRGAGIELTIMEKEEAAAPLPPAGK